MDVRKLEKLLQRDKHRFMAEYDQAASWFKLSPSQQGAIYRQKVWHTYAYFNKNFVAGENFKETEKMFYEMGFQRRYYKNDELPVMLALVTHARDKFASTPTGRSEEPKWFFRTHEESPAINEWESYNSWVKHFEQRIAVSDVHNAWQGLRYK